MAQRDLIDRAKALLAAENGTTEAEAYRALQKLAMDKRKSMGVMAASIVEQHDQRGDIKKAKQYLMEKGAFRKKRRTV